MTMSDDEIYDFTRSSVQRYARIASWNVACMNNFDLPTTIEQVDIKISNIAGIITSHCDIVALQELPYIITLKRNEEKDKRHLII